MLQIEEKNQTVYQKCHNAMANPKGHFDKSFLTTAYVYIYAQYLLYTHVYSGMQVYIHICIYYTKAVPPTFFFYVYYKVRRRRAGMKLVKLRISYTQSFEGYPAFRNCNGDDNDNDVTPRASADYMRGYILILLFIGAVVLYDLPKGVFSSHRLRGCIASSAMCKCCGWVVW